MRLLCVVVFILGLGAGLAYASFDDPATPQPVTTHAEYANFDVQVHSRDNNTWDDNTLESMSVQHGADCSAPPATHENYTYAGAVFICSDHVMTAISAQGYGMIALTPNQLLNCSNACSVQWDMSTERMSTRDWPDVWLTPWSDNLNLPFDMGDVDLQGVPRQGLHVSAAANQNSWCAGVIANFTESMLPCAWWVPMGEGITPGTNESAVRQTFKITLTPGHVRMERLPSSTATALVWVDADAPVLLTPNFVVQFAQHSYNPVKDGAGVPQTRHWDNFALSPASPFTIIHSPTRTIQGTSGSVSFNAPAPANSWLRFSAVGTIQFSTNNGSTWQNATKQAFLSHPEHKSSYFLPIPAGTQTVQIRFSPDSWYTGPYIAQDFAIWSSSSQLPDNG